MNNITDVQPPKSRDNIIDQQQNYGARAYIDQSEYESYKQPIVVAKQDGAIRTNYSNFTQSNTNNFNKSRQISNQDKDNDDDDDDHDDDSNKPQRQQQYTKPSSAAYHGLLARTNSSSGLQPAHQVQPRVISAKQRNFSSSSTLNQVI